MPESQDSLERLSEFRIENGVNQWIDTRVDVSQPSCDDECGVAGKPTQFELDTNGIDDVTSEKGNPTDKETD